MLNQEKETRCTLKVRTFWDRELWIQRIDLPHNIQNMISDIVCTEGFEAGEFMIEIFPYNPTTDIENIGNFKVLGKRTQFT